MNRPWLAVLLLPLLAGCPDPGPDLPSLEPSLKSFDVGPAFQGQPVPIQVGVTIPGASDLRVRSVNAEYRSTSEPDLPWIPAEAELDGSASGGFAGFLPPLNYGPYEAKVRVQMRPFTTEAAPPEAPDTFLEDSKSFFVNADDAAGSPAEAPECFGFSSEAQGVQGWTHSGMSVNGSPTNGCEALAWLPQGDGVLAVPMSFSCLPAEAWQFDLISPDLSSRPGWMNTTGVMIRLDSNFPLTAGVVLVTGDGEEHPGPTVDIGEPQIEFRTSIAQIDTDGAAPTEVRVRVTTPDPQAGAAVAEGLLMVSAVCPIPER